MEIYIGEMGKQPDIEFHQAHALFESVKFNTECIKHISLYNYTIYLFNFLLKPFQMYIGYCGSIIIVFMMIQGPLKYKYTGTCLLLINIKCRCL